MSTTDIAISTSRKPSQRTRSFCKELQFLLPRASYIQRGKSNFEELLERSDEVKARLLLVVGEREGNPGSFSLYSMKDPAEPILTFEIEGLRLAREYGSHARGRSKVLAVSSDSSANSGKLQARLELYFKAEHFSPINTRTLFISSLELGRFRLTFMDSSHGHEIGPSMTGRLSV